MNSTRRYRKFVIFALSFGLLLFVAKAYYDTNSIEIRHYQMENSFLGGVLAGLKVAFLSDLHIRSVGLRENKVLDILNEEKPDLILLTGDYISFEGPYDPAMSFLKRLEAPLGIYGVLGNTEYSNENGSCTLCHEERSKILRKKSNPKFLRNSLVRLKANGKALSIIGLDDPVNKKSDLKTTFGGVDPKGPSILLSHSPEVFDEACRQGVDFILSGHNHGGQIFITKLLRKILPFDPVLEYLGGFFQKEKTLMYVSRGIGTSFLPFRLGVKPEITFFEFTNNTNEKTNDTNEKIRMARMNSTTQSLVVSPQSLVNQGNSFLISNNPPKTIFTGLSLSNFLETFNLFGFLNSKNPSNPINPSNSASAPQHRNTNVLPLTSNGVLLQPPTKVDPINPSNSINSKNLFDFESDEDLKGLNWECHKWFELSEENATSGKYSLKVSLPPGEYPGINFEEMNKDWSGYRLLRMDFLNPGDKILELNVRIDDQKSGWEYANRFDIGLRLKPGMNNISIPIDSIRTNIHSHSLNLKRIKRMMFFIANNPQKKELYIDYIRLE